MIQIDGRLIGPGQLCYVVAEIGCNHNGDIRQAEKLIDAAKGAGADCVKFQVFNAHRLLPVDSPMYRRVLPLELSEGQLRHLQGYARDRGITWFATPDQMQDADLLESMDVPAYKIGSGNLQNLPFLRHVARKGKPILLSTGMGNLEDVRRAVNALLSPTYGATPLVLLHCASVYPERMGSGKQEQDPAPWNLRAIETLKQFGHPVGYSDHSRSGLLVAVAVAMGACVYEGHMYLDSPDGPDGSVSISPESFAWHVHNIRWLEAALGDGEKRVMDGERATVEYVESWRR